MPKPRQLTFLDHRMRTGRGGPRRGAGRKPARRPIVHHVRREAFARETPALVTVRVKEGLPSLRRRRVVEGIRETFAACCVRDGFRLVHYSVQRDHVHMIVEARDQRALGRGMMSVVARLAFAVNRAVRRRGRVLAGRYHVRLLESPRQVRNALRYVLLNLRKHLRASTGYAGPAAVDEASSGCWFDGWLGFRARAPARRREVARPRTWLLAGGWRKHGAIALAEIPGG